MSKTSSSLTKIGFVRSVQMLCLKDHDHVMQSPTALGIIKSVGHICQFQIGFEMDLLTQNHGS
jgi:hypothetical protein